jgi:hypothetical protein
MSLGEITRYPTLTLAVVIVLAGIIILLVIGIRHKFPNLAKRLQMLLRKQHINTAPSEPKAIVYTIEVPPKTPYNPGVAVALIEHLVETYANNVAFRLSSESGKVTFELIDLLPAASRGDPTLAIKSVYGPQTAVNTRPWTPTPYSEHTHYHMLAPLFHGSQIRDEWYLSSVHLTEVNADPLIYLVYTMGEAAKSGVVTNLTFCLSSATFGDSETRDEARRKLLGLPSDSEKIVKGIINTVGSITLAFIDTALDSVTGKRDRSGYGTSYGGIVPVKYKTPPPEQILKQCLNKVNSPHLYELQGVLEVYGNDESRVTEAVVNVSSHLTNRYRGEVLGMGIHKQSIMGEAQVRKVESQAQLDTYSLFAYTNYLHEHNKFLKKTLAVVTSDELAALWHLPYQGMAAEYAVFSSGSQPPKDILENQEGTRIGHYKQRPIFMTDQDRRQHVNIIGKTGTGKSNLMLNMIRQDISRGKGVGVIDPHGMLVSDVLQTAIPDDRIGDVVVIDVTNRNNPPPLNPLTIKDDNGQIAAGTFTEMMNRLYEDFSRAERAQVFLNGALRTLAYVETPTIRDVVKLLQDEEFLYNTISPRQNDQTIDPTINIFWTELFVPLTDSQKRDLPFPAIYRLSNFYSSDFLYPILCHPDSLEWGELMSQNKIILVSLDTDTGTVRNDDRQLLGTMALSQFEAAARRLGTASGLDYYLYVDEVQTFTNTPLNAMFDEIRKYGIRLTVGNQYLGQLKDEVLASIMGNVGGSFIFELGIDGKDATTLEDYIQPNFSKADLISLGNYHAVAKMKYKGKTEPAFDLYPYGPDPTTSEEKQRLKQREVLIRQMSIDKYTPRTREQIMGWLNSRYPYRKMTLSRSIRRQEPSPDQWKEKGK